jgi:hypothetical protein
MAPVNVVRISVAISGTDFTAYEADFSALIRAAEAEGFGRGGRAIAYGVFICVMTKASLPLSLFQPRRKRLLICPNAAENIWQYLRQTYLSNRVFETYTAILDACQNAWRSLLNELGRIASIASRDWASTG